MKIQKIIYWGSTGLLSIMMLMSAGMYFINWEALAENFLRLGYPAEIIYPLGAAKIAGILAILSHYSDKLSEWAYAGFAYVFILASMAHLYAGDGQFIAPLVALTLLLSSYSTASVRSSKNESATVALGSVQLQS